MHADVSEVMAFARDISRNADKVPALTRVAVKKVGFDTVASAQAVAPVDTGNLKNSIGIDFTEDELGFEAGPTAEYGWYVEDGTDPHWIENPFGWGENTPWFNTIRVWHPGTDPQPYMAPAADKEFGALEDVLGLIGGRAFDG